MRKIIWKQRMAGLLVTTLLTMQFAGVPVNNFKSGKTARIRNVLTATAGDAEEDDRQDGVLDATPSDISRWTASGTQLASISNVHRNPESIQLSQSEMTLTETYEGNLTAKVYPEDSTDLKDLTWESMDPDVAVVDQEGKVTALAPGNTEIVVSAENEAIWDSCKVTVKESINPITGIQLSGQKPVMEKREEVQLHYHLEPANTTDNGAVTWESSNPEVASVDQKGKVTAYKTGNTVIVAKTCRKGIEVQYELSVASKGKALLFYSTNTNLGNSTKLDAENMYQVLSSMNEFEAKDIQIIPLDALTNEEAKRKMQTCIEQEFKDNDEKSNSLIMYSGHGGNQVDGSSTLALGDEGGDLTAEELRNQLNQYEGSFQLLISACFSGGMLRSVKTDEERSMEFAENFVQTFAEKNLRARSSYDGNRFKIITAAHNSEVGWSYDDYGTMLFRTLSRGLGYERDNKNYSNYAADLDGDQVITLGEMENFLSKQYLISTPVVFPEEDDTPVFSYSTGTSAYFDAELEQVILKGKLTENEDREVEMKVSIPIDITRYKDELDKVFFKVHALDGDGTFSTLSTFTEGEYEWTYELEDDRCSTNIEVLIPASDLDKKWCVRVGCEEEGGSYQILTFTVDGEKQEEYSYMWDYLRIDEPYTTSVEEPEPEEVQGVYQKDLRGNVNSIPVTVRFDEEPTTKIGAAACKLTLKIYTAKAPEKMEEPWEVDTDPYKTLYEDYRPSYIADSRLHDVNPSTDTVSHYTRFLNLQELEPGYYQMKVFAEYDETDQDGEPITQTAHTYLHVMEQGDTTKVISEWESQYGISLQEGQSLQAEMDDFFFDNPLDNEINAQVTQKIVGWSYIDEDGNVHEIPESNWAEIKIQRDTAYVLTIEANINPDVNAIFSPNCRSYKKGYSVDGTQVAADGKTMTFLVTHNEVENPDPDPDPEPKPDPEKPKKEESSDEDTVYPVANQENSSDNWEPITTPDGKTLWKCYVPGSGYVLNDWKKLIWNGISGWYRFDLSGYMITGWFTDTAGNTYYLNPKSDGRQGIMLTGWQWIDEKQYYFDPESGAMKK